MKSLPLVNLSLLRPLLQALRERRVDPETVLESVGLTEDAIAQEGQSVHVMVVHEFLEACAAAVDDKTFCASVGARVNPTGWPMIKTALESGGSLADFLTTYVSRSNEVASSVTAYLDIRGGRAVFGETRNFRPTILPAQNDGFMVSLAVGILQQALGDQLEPVRTTIVVCDPNVLPDSFAPFQILKGDEMGFRIQFPSSWLVYSVADMTTDKSGDQTSSDESVSQFLSDLRALISRNIGEGGLSAEDLAAIVSMSRTKLARILAKEGTTISKELRNARVKYARERLSATDQTIDEIGAALGYTDTSNFTRAFRQEEGISPRAFRHQADTGKTQ